MEVSLSHILNTRMHTKTACSSREVVQYVNRKFLQFYYGYFINFYRMKHWKLSIIFCTKLYIKLKIFKRVKLLNVNLKL